MTRCLVPLVSVLAEAGLPAGPAEVAEAVRVLRAAGWRVTRDCRPRWVADCTADSRQRLRAVLVSALGGAPVPSRAEDEALRQKRAASARKAMQEVAGGG